MLVKEGEGDRLDWYRFATSGQVFIEMTPNPKRANEGFNMMFNAELIHQDVSPDDYEKRREKMSKHRNGADFQITHIKKICKHDEPRDWELGEYGVKFYLVDNTSWIKFLDENAIPSQQSQSLPSKLCEFNEDMMEIQFIELVYAAKDSPIALSRRGEGWYLGKVVLQKPLSEIYAFEQM